jgi:xanthine dehydrogenase large subunit
MHRDAETVERSSTQVGRAVPHESAPAHVTGAAVYTDDLAGRLTGVLHAWPVTSPHAHARVLAIDLSRALAIAGVVTVLTDGDAPGDADSGAARRDEPLFPREALFHRQPIVWVLAESMTAAKAGAANVDVRYEPLPAVLSIRDAIASASFLTDTLRLSCGDMTALESSSTLVSGELEIGGQEHFYLETQAALAWMDESGNVVVHSSTQHPSGTQEIVARVLGVPRHQVVIECLRMGGAFGGKEVQASTYAAVAALGTWKTRRPVRVRLTRELDMAITGKRHPYLARYSAGLDADGRIRAVRIALFSDGGWSLDLSEPVMWRSLFHCDNAYYLPAVELTGRVCRTNKTSQTAFRGFGGPQGMLVIEEILSRAAKQLCLRPEVVRERNFYQDGHATHYGQPVGDGSRITRIWTDLKRTSAFEARRSEIDQWNAGQPHARRGLAITPVKFGISFTTTYYNQAGALVLIYRDGSVQVNHGGTEMGQGLGTKVRQIAADALGVSLERVRLMTTRTDKVPNTSATAASAGTDLNGAAVADACEQLRSRLEAVAAAMLQCDEGSIAWRDGFLHGPAGEALRFADVCDAAYLARTPLFAQGFYRTPGLSFDPAIGRGSPFYYFTYGAAVSEVEVDGFTGMYQLRRTDILQDVGDSLSPTIDRGQIEGGFIQGVGWLTLEELLWDGHGRLATAGASTYKLPSWSEVPEQFEVQMLHRSSQPGVVMGSKAVGEPPLMLAISVREALRDAVSAFGPGAVDRFPSPLTPEQVFFAVREARAHHIGGG